jgi:hypothetical protein
MGVHLIRANPRKFRGKKKFKNNAAQASHPGRIARE